MKRNLLVYLACMAMFASVAIPVHAQEPAVTKKTIGPCMDFGLGYVPKAEYQAFRASIAVNNIVFKRFGAYTAVEYSPSTDYFAHILGITGSITHYLYLYGGAAVFGQHGLLKAGLGCRKNFGVGVSPYKWLTLKVGYSLSVGVTAEIGAKFPIGKGCCGPSGS